MLRKKSKKKREIQAASDICSRKTSQDRCRPRKNSANLSRGSFAAIQSQDSTE
jgi:hypothetical protein